MQKRYINCTMKYFGKRNTLIVNIDGMICEIKRRALKECILVTFCGTCIFNHNDAEEK